MLLLGVGFFISFIDLVLFYHLFSYYPFQGLTSGPQVVVFCIVILCNVGEHSCLHFQAQDLYLKFQCRENLKSHLIINVCMCHPLKYLILFIFLFYSMMGMNVDVRNSIGKEVGIIPRFCHELFERIASLEDSNVGAGKSAADTANVEISYFEIYNEKIHDLLGGLSDGGKRTPLKVREHPVFGPYVVDLSVHGVTSYEDLQVGSKQTLFLRK